MTEDADALLKRFGAEFPGISRETIVRQMQDATESVALFGIAPADGADLVARLVQAHLEALAAIQRD